MGAKKSWAEKIQAGEPIDIDLCREIVELEMRMLERLLDDTIGEAVKKAGKRQAWTHEIIGFSRVLEEYADRLLMATMLDPAKADMEKYKQATAAAKTRLENKMERMGMDIAQIDGVFEEVHDKVLGEMYPRQAQQRKRA